MTEPTKRDVEQRVSDLESTDDTDTDCDDSDVSVEIHNPDGTVVDGHGNPVVDEERGGTDEDVGLDIQIGEPVDTVSGGGAT